MSLHYLEKYLCSKNAMLSEANCHERLNHSKFAEKFLSCDKALFNLLFTAVVLQIPRLNIPNCSDNEKEAAEKCCT